MLKSLLLLLAAAAAAQAHEPWVMAHRGGRAAMPENTMAAFRYAASLGVDVIELDMAVTADDRLVISHDSNVDLAICKLPAGEQPQDKVFIRALTLAEARRFDCGGTRNPAWPRQKLVPGERMPTLEEVFEFARNGSFDLMIETKMLPADAPVTVSPEHFAKLVYEIVKRFNMQDRIILQSFDHRTLVEMRKLDKRVRLCLLNPARHLEDYIRPAKDLGAQYQFINYRVILAADVEALHHASLKVFSGTTDDPEVWKKLIALKVDGILTDDPAGLLELLQSDTGR
jgi:glycerophosphoryl diester phosphodiesterase